MGRGKIFLNNTILVSYIKKTVRVEGRQLKELREQSGCHCPYRMNGLQDDKFPLRKDTYLGTMTQSNLESEVTIAAIGITISNGEKDFLF